MKNILKQMAVFVLVACLLITGEMPLQAAVSKEADVDDKQSQVGTVQGAYDDDEDWEDDDDWDDGDDDDWDDGDDDDGDDEEDSWDSSDYSNVGYTYDEKALSETESIELSEESIPETETYVLPIRVTQSAEYQFDITDGTYGKCSYQLIDEEGNVIFEETEIEFSYDGCSVAKTMMEGMYYLNILSLESIGLEFAMNVSYSGEGNGIYYGDWDATDFSNVTEEYEEQTLSMDEPVEMGGLCIPVTETHTVAINVTEDAGYFLTVSTEEMEAGTCSYQLLDENGEVLVQKIGKLMDNQIYCDYCDLTEGQYYFKILSLTEEGFGCNVGIYEQDYYSDEETEAWPFDDFSNVSKTYAKQTISQSKKMEVSYEGFSYGETHVIPLKVEKKTKYIFGFTDDTYGICSFRLLNSSGKELLCEYEKEFEFNAWSQKLTLSAGTYRFEILSLEEFDMDYSMYAKPEKVVVKKTYNQKLTSCTTMKFDPKLGKGTWKTSNAKVVSLETNKKAATCTVRAKKAGSATVTYSNSDGSQITYKCTVKAGKLYPIEEAYFIKDSKGGIKPMVRVSNNSDKKVKRVEFTVSFYDKRGKRLTSTVGRYKDKSLYTIQPLKAWDSSWYSWKTVFSNPSATQMKIDSATITYSNGSKKTVKINKKYSVKK